MFPEGFPFHHFYEHYICSRDLNPCYQFHSQTSLPQRYRRRCSACPKICSKMITTRPVLAHRGICPKAVSTLANWHYAEATISLTTPLDKWQICLTKQSFVSKDMRLCFPKYMLILVLVNGLWISRNGRSGVMFILPKMCQCGSANTITV